MLGDAAPGSHREETAHLVLAEGAEGWRQPSATPRSPWACRPRTIWAFVLPLTLICIAGSACLRTVRWSRPRPRRPPVAGGGAVLTEAPGSAAGRRGGAAREDGPGAAPTTAPPPAALARTGVGASWNAPEEQEPRLDDYVRAVVTLQRQAELEWEVVLQGAPVRVRASRSLQSQVLGTRAAGEVLIGRRAGDWVQLINGRGFVKISLDPADPHTALVKRRNASYAELASGRCSDVGMYPILDTRVCHGAGLTLGRGGNGVSVYPGAELLRPEGCYVLEDSGHEKLWVATNPANRGHGASRLRRQLCSSRAAYEAIRVR